MKLTVVLRMVLLPLVVVAAGCAANEEPGKTEAAGDGGGSSLDCAPVADSALVALRRSASGLEELPDAFAAEVGGTWVVAASRDAGVGLWRSDVDPTRAGSRIRLVPLNAAAGSSNDRVPAAASDAAGVRAIVECAGSE